MKVIGEKAVLAMKAFVCDEGFGQFAVVEVAEEASGREGFLKRKMEIKLYEAEE